MANRLLLSKDGVKISLPGVDVLTAGSSNLQFSSDWAQLKIFMRGSISFGTGTTDVPFGKTFTNRPLGFFTYGDFDFSGRIIQMADLWAIWGEYPGVLGMHVPLVYVLVLNDRIRFHSYSGSRSIRYVIWDFDL